MVPGATGWDPWCCRLAAALAEVRLALCLSSKAFCCWRRSWCKSTTGEPSDAEAEEAGSGVPSSERMRRAMLFWALTRT
eukprot:3177311-Amphidinium_carterae.1